MRKLYYFFVYAGEVLFVWALMFITSISLQSLVIKGKVDYGGRCVENFDDTFIKDYSYQGVTLIDGYLKCNTYYLEYKSDLEEDKQIIFLVSISKLFYDNKIDSDIHVIIESNNYQIISTIVDYRVSFTKTKI